MNEVIELAQDIYAVSGLPLELCGAIAQDLVDRGYGKREVGENVTGTPSLFECSVCHWYDWDTTTGDTSEYNYCPNCGAKMEDSSNG